MARRGGSSESKDGMPSDGLGGTPLRMPRSLKIGWWPRRNAFHTHKALLENGEK